MTGQSDEKDQIDHCPRCDRPEASFKDSDGVWRCWICEARLVTSPGLNG